MNGTIAFRVRVKARWDSGDCIWYCIPTSMRLSCRKTPAFLRQLGCRCNAFDLIAAKRGGSHENDTGGWTGRDRGLSDGTVERVLCLHEGLAPLLLSCDQSLALIVHIHHHHLIPLFAAPDPKRHALYWPTAAHLKSNTLARRTMTVEKD